MVFPQMNLSPEATPWGREMQKRLESQTAENARLRQDVDGLSRTLGAVMNALGNVNVDPSDIDIALTTGTLDQSRVTGVWDKAVDTTSTVEADGNISTVAYGVFNAGVQSVGTYNQSVAGMGGFRTISVAMNTGMYGGVTSSRRYKEDIREPDIPLETLRALNVLMYRYIAQTDSPEPLQMSLMAEDVHDLGLEWLVDYDEEGRPDGLNERAMPYVAILLAQMAHDRIDNLEQGKLD